jgi:HAD superfamily hydrolase (TIGR01509 family)
MQLDLVIFDNDGVVVDSELLANRVLAELLTGYGHTTTVEESMADYMGGTLASVRTAVLERFGRELPADFEASYHERLFHAYASDLRPVPGIESVLDSMTRPFCLASSGSVERIVTSLSITGLRSYFGDRIFSAEQVAHGKPAPDLFLHAAAAMGAPPARCVVVEDSPNGVAAGRAAGMVVLGFAARTPPERLGGAHRIFAVMDDLPALLDDVLHS